MKSYGSVLKKLRKEKKETIQSVASQIGISYQALQAYENEQRNPRDEIKVKLARFYNVPIEKIFLPTNNTKRDIYCAQILTKELLCQLKFLQKK